MAARTEARWVVAVAGAALVITAALLMFSSQSSGAADCDIARFTVNGQPDIASYLQCQAPSVTPAVVSPGGQVTVSAGGYAANCSVEIVLNPGGVVLATVTANNFGNISTTVTIPSSTALGAYEIWATCVDPAGKPLTNVLALEVSRAGSTTTGSTSRSLPVTGSGVGGYLGVGMALVALGGAVLWGVRRGRLTTDS